jgi:predicted aminopeptidase
VSRNVSLEALVEFGRKLKISTRDVRAIEYCDMVAAYLSASEQNVMDIALRKSVKVVAPSNECEKCERQRVKSAARLKKFRSKEKA